MRGIKIDSNILVACSIWGGSTPTCFLQIVSLKNKKLHKSSYKYYYIWSKKWNCTIKKTLGQHSFNCKKEMDDDCKYSDLFSNEDHFQRRLSTFEDVQMCTAILKEVLEYRNKNISSWIIEGKVKKLCSFYKCFLKNHKNEFIQVLAKDYAVNHKQVFQLAAVLAKYANMTGCDTQIDGKTLKNEDQLRNILTPEYSWLFLLIGKLEKGVKFLVDLRTDVLDLIAEKSAANESTIELQQLNTTLKDLLSLWFSIGFLCLQRVTWNSSCEMLEKISEYEAVHPIKNWTDLKRRVGPYRRCFVFLHSSMPGEPIVVLHTALCEEISSSMSGIVTARSRMSVDSSINDLKLLDPLEEDSTNIKAAVFYSISSTQKGLRGIELGNYLIKSVVHELQVEFPQMTQFSSLSPIPNFKIWLIEKLKSAEKGLNDVLLQEEIDNLKEHISAPDFWKELKKILHTNVWIENKNLVLLLEIPLMRLCARYLFIEKHRGYALDSVANFHLKNGAALWRLNWAADWSSRGLGNSCSIMVNYRYFLEDTESNSQAYVENFTITASEQILKLAEQAKQLMIISKM